MEHEELAATAIALMVAWLWALNHKESHSIRTARMVSSVQDSLYQNILLPYRSEISRFIGLLFFRKPFTCDCCCLTLGGQDQDAEYVSSQCFCQRDADSKYCYNCIATYLDNQVTDEQASTLVCLNGRRCRLDDRYVRRRLNKRMVSMLDRNQIAKAATPQNEKLWRCPTPDCNFVGFISSRTRNSSGPSAVLSRFMYFSKISRDNRMVRCPACLIASCQFCQRAWTRGVADHLGLSCSAYAKKFESNTDRSLDSWVAKQSRTVQNCPACASVIEKSDGCNHMTCRCGHDFCWVCGEPWSNQHSYFCKRYRRIENRQGVANKVMSFFGNWF